MYLSDCNMKVGCPTWSLPARETCKPGELHCKKYCYAAKAERVWKTAEQSRRSNYAASLHKRFVARLARLVECSGQKTVRIHESGDFYSVEYIQKWYAIARQCYDVLFYAYTKRDDLFTEGLMSRKPSNLILIYSWDGVRAGWWWAGKFRTQEDFDRQDAEMRGRGFANCVYVVDQQGNCPSQIDGVTKCNEPCRKCMVKSGQAVLLARH